MIFFHSVTIICEDILYIVLRIGDSDALIYIQIHTVLITLPHRFRWFLGRPLEVVRTCHLSEIMAAAPSPSHRITSTLPFASLAHHPSYIL